MRPTLPKVAEKVTLEIRAEQQKQASQEKMGRAFQAEGAARSEVLGKDGV